MKKIFVVLAVYFAALFISSISFSKPMPQRLGLGIKNNTTQSIPSLAVVYNINNDMAVTSGLGFDTQRDYSSSQINLGIRHVIFHETNLHFYGGGQAALVSYEDPINGKKTGFEADLVLGTEFFFSGLENVGFTFEGGMGLSTVYNTRVRTVALHPLEAGIIFYF